jgi:PST family polysaccharide transporter
MRRQASWLFATRLIGAASQAFLLILVARDISPSDFGTLNIALSLATYVGVLLDFGLSTLSLKAASIDSNLNLALGVIRLNKVINIGLVSVGFCLLLGCVHFVQLHLLWICFGSITWVALEKSAEVESTLFLARQSVSQPAIAIISRRVTSLLLYPIFSQLLGSSAGFILCIVVGSAVGVTYCTFASRKIRSEVNLAVRPRGKEILRLSAPYAVANISAQMKNLDSTAILIGGGALASGQYSAASRLSSPVFLATSAIASSVMPAMVKSGTPMAQSVTRGIAILGASSLVACAALLPFANQLMDLVYGHQYATYGLAFVVILAGTLMNALHSPLTSVLQGLGRSKLVARVSFIVGASMLGLMITGSSIGGVLGGGFGYLLATCSGALVFAYLCFKYLKVAWVR